MLAVISIFRIGTGTIHFTNLSLFYFKIYFIVICPLYNSMISLFRFMEF